eukprot:gene1566-3027_t
MQQSKDQQYSYEVEYSQTESTGPIRRCLNNKIQGHIALNGCFTCFEIFERNVKLNSDLKCLGERITEPAGNPGKFNYLTYKQVGDSVRQFASGLVHENLVMPNPDGHPDGMSLFGIFMTNCPHWIIAEQACYSLSVATVPIFETFGIEHIKFIIDQTSLQTILCNEGGLRRLLLTCHTCEALKCIIINTDRINEDIISEANLIAPHIRLTTWNEIITSGKNNPTAPRPPSPKDIATFCYTSGTTGNPKGALITHQNMVVTITSCMENEFNITNSDTYLSYLPLSHIFERFCVASLLSAGARIAFYRGGTQDILDDIKALRPTIFCAVPRLLTRIHQMVIQDFAYTPGFQSKLFCSALETKLARLHHYQQVSHWFFDSMIFNPMKKALGLDRVRIMLSGSAPLPEDTMKFFRVLLGTNATVFQGYGQTESSGAISITAASDLSCGHVGAPVPSIDIRLLDIPDMGYLHTDTDHNGTPCNGRGEVCIRGPAIFSGYYKSPSDNEDVFAKDGQWVLTGDVGMWTKQGQLVLIDRRKHLFKLSQGEYIAVDRVENILYNAPFVHQIFIYGKPTENCIVAIVVPDEKEVKKWCTNNTWRKSTGEEMKSCDTDENLLEIYNSNEFHAALLEQLREVGRTGGLLGYEIVKDVYVEAQPWITTDTMPDTTMPASTATPEEKVTACGGGGAAGSGETAAEIRTTRALLTPTWKIRRDVARKKYAIQLEDMYDRLRSQTISS